MTKKIINKIISLIIIMTVFLGFGFTTVKAASVPSSIKVSSIGKINYGGTYYFPVKYTSDGTLAYCTEFYDQFPMSITMTNPKKVDAGLAYIIANGYHGTKSEYGNDAAMKQYYITQLAVYTYLGQANPSKTNDVHKAVWKLVDEAKAAKSSTSSALSVSLSISNKTMKLTSDKEYFISEAITVKSNSSKAMPVSVSANTNAFVVNKDGKKVTTVSNGDVVYIKMPSSQISAGQTITFSMGVSVSRTTQNAYVYTPSESKYQNIIPGVTYPSKETASAKVTVQATKDKIVTKTVISKQDITTKKELPGAKLVIKDANGKEVISWTSGTTAKTISGLNAGSYTLCETAAPAGYELYTECIKFTVKADGTTSKVIMYNTPKKEVTKVVISKQDITTKEELPGAKLVIKDANGKEVISWTSGTTAKQITGLTAGNYTLCETAAPTGYELYTECIKFTVKADGTATKVIMYNRPKKSVTTKVVISKQDITTKKELPGAKLVIKNSKGEVVEEWTSTSTSKQIDGMEAGDYTLCETAAPAGYELYTECIKFTVKADGTTTKVVMYNTPKKEEVKKTTVVVSKQDITTKKELPGAKLVIKDANGKEVISWTSGTTAKQITGLTAGDYTLCETAAPAGYELYTECIKFTVKADGTTTKVVMYNTPKKEEVKKTTVVVSKQDITTKKELPGAKLMIKDASGKEVISWTSGTTAKQITGLTAGSYTLCETAAPTGYELYTECIKFTVKADGTTTKVIMYNSPKKEEVKQPKLAIVKKDSETKKNVAGAVLVLKDESGKVVEEWTTTTEEKVFSNLKAGKYTLSEIKAPNGYELSTATIDIELKDENKTTSVVFYNTPKKVVTKVQVSKQDITTKEELPGATLVIKNSKGEVVNTWVSTTEPKYIEGLEAGKYTLCETQAPAGYVLATECVDFTVKADGSITKVVMYNTKEVKPEQPEKVVTKVQISKQDITTKEELPGATLVIKNSKGEVVNTWVSTTEPKYIEGLEAGKYTLCETQAPDGYVLATECVDFTVKADGSITKVVMYNTKEQKEETKKSYKTKVFKLDRDTKAAIAGATLVIKNENGEELHRFVSNDTATEFELQPGTYTLTEVIAPEGYLLSDEVVTFTVSEDETVVTEVIMYNTKAVNVPITSSSVSILVYLVGLLGIAYGLKTVLTNARL